jgi:hypothetical protein
MSLSKKHIVISREGGDFSMDLIFAGLVRRFGKENVIDWPVRAKHRQGPPVLIGDDEKDYGAERRSLCYVKDCEDLKEWTQKEIIEAGQKGEIGYIFMDETDESFRDFLDIRGARARRGEVAVVIAGHDSFRGDPPNVKSRFGHLFKHMFIDDWMAKYDGYDFASLTNLSCNFDHLWEVSKREEFLQNKVYDICFIGYNSNPARKFVIDHVKKKWNHLTNCIIFEERHNKFDRFMRHDEMFKLMAQSRICLNLPGASTGGRALRYYETPYVGSLMVTMRFDAKLLNPFWGPKFSTLEELDQIIQSAIKTPVARESIAAKQHRQCMKYHTIDARMDYIFGILDGQTKAI